MLHFDDVPGKRLVISRKLSELGCDVARVLSTRSETPADISSGTAFERSLSSYVIVAVGVGPRRGRRLSREPPEFAFGLFEYTVLMIPPL